MKRFLQILCLLPICILAFSLTSCRTAPLYNVKQTSVPMTKDHTYTSLQVKKAITAAAVSLGWTVSYPSANMVIATLHLRGNTAVVSIPYTATHYSILYKSSDGLLYDKDEMVIHRNYNGWVQNLNQSIQGQLMATKVK